MIRLANFIAAVLLTMAGGLLVSPGHAEEGKFGTPKGDEGTRIFKAAEASPLQRRIPPHG
ncbi:MAG TPA: hypothetical protein VN666_13895 [Nitrospira sp.]|nr:hypothetical protein [Nitrospira sp.]